MANGLMKRPNGDTPISMGWLAIIAGAVLCGLSVMIIANDEIGPGTLICIFLGGGLFNLGVLLTAIGYVLRALYFLPGRDVRVAEFDPSVAYQEAKEAHEAAMSPEEREAAEEAAAEQRRADNRQSAWFFAGLIAVGACILGIAIWNSEPTRTGVDLDVENATNAADLDNLSAVDGGLSERRR